jgi:alanine-glyoxylate transaminase/serine-glyoxylate transaminase/serine-pyruvate transaminase
MSTTPRLQIPERILLGPGPSMVHPRVYQALGQPVLGHLDPQFLALMSDIQADLRYVFQTQNQLTIPVSGTGSAAMECALCNFIEPGDSVVVGVIGYFGTRMVDMAGRYGATVRRLDKPWGDVFSLDEIEAELKKAPAKVLALVHAETSTGALQPMEGMAELAHRYGALLVIDCVTSLGGLPVKVDEWGVDVAYSGTQKCIGAPPGLGPITVSERAREVLRNRKTPVANWYLDLSSIEKYWGNARTYHHTAPISMNYGLYEALQLVREEGLEARFARHRRHAELLWAGLEDMDLALHVPPAHRLPCLTTVRIPEGVTDTEVRGRLLKEYNLEIAGGFGELAGKIWRIGLMGYSSRPENVDLLLGALKTILGR